jgi:hypothetical protein
MSNKKVKKRVEMHALMDANDKIKSQYKRGFQEFDKNGNLLKDVLYKPNGEIESAQGFTYDDKNRLVEEIHYYEGGETGEQIRFKLDKEGKREEIETTYADGSKSLKKIVRFENMISVKSFDEDGDFESEELVKYNSNGDVIEELAYDDERNIVTKHQYEYDGKNRLKARTDYEGEKEFIVRIELAYDYQDQVISETHLNRKGELMRKVSYEYDEKGNQVALQNNHLVTRTTFDEEGKPVRQEIVNNASGFVENFTDYTYDDNGMLIEQRSFAIGEQYELEPGVQARTQSAFVVTGYEYEFF